MQVGMEELTRILGSPVNLQILSILSTRAMYPRELARLLGKDETDVSRRLKRLERLGILIGEWKRVAGRNVRVYRAVSGEISIKFSPSGITVDLGGQTIELPPVLYGNQPPPFPDPPVGRDEELELLASNQRPVVHVWGVSGTGKTHLVSYFLTRIKPGPVLWYRISREDVRSSLISRIYLFVSALGYGLVGPPEYVDEGELAEAISATGIRVVIDDYHEARDEGLRITVKRLAHMVRGHGVLYILSRKKARGLPLLEGRVLEMRLGPLGFDGFYKLLARHVDISEDDAREVYRVTGGIPILALATSTGIREKRLPPVEAAAFAVRAYFNGRLAEVLLEEDLDIIEALAVAELPLDTVVLSRVTGVSRLRWRLERLAEAGIVEATVEGYRLHQAFMGYRRLIPRRRLKALASRLGRILVNDPNEAYMVRGVSLLAESCDPLLGEIAARRLAYGEFWTMKWARPYIEALQDALNNCKSLSPLDMLYIKAELLVTKGFAGSVEGVELARSLEVVASRLADAAPHLASKLYSISSLHYASHDIFDKALEALEKAGVYADKASGELATKALLTYYSNLAYLYSRMHRFQDMADTLEELTKMYGQPGDDPLEYADVISYLSSIRFTQGDLEAAVELGMEVYGLLRQFGYAMLFPKMCSSMLLALLALGKAVEVLNLIEENKRFLKSVPEYSMVARLFEALAHAVLGDRAAVENLCTKDFNPCRPGDFIGGEECLAWKMLRAWRKGGCGEIVSYTADSKGLALLAPRLVETCSNNS